MSTLQAEKKIPISWHSLEGCCSRWKMQSSPENTSVAFATCVAHQLRPRYRLDVLGGLHRQ